MKTSTSFLWYVYRKQPDRLAAFISIAVLLLVDVGCMVHHFPLYPPTTLEFVAVGLCLVLMLFLLYQLKCSYHQHNKRIK